MAREAPPLLKVNAGERNEPMEGYLGKQCPRQRGKREPRPRGWSWCVPGAARPERMKGKREAGVSGSWKDPADTLSEVGAEPLEGLGQKMAVT